MSPTMTPAGEGRVWTSTTSAASPEDRVAWFVTFASVTARAGSASASANAGAKRMLLYMGDLLVLRVSSDLPSRAATERPFTMALARSWQKQPIVHLFIRGSSRRVYPA